MNGFKEKKEEIWLNPMTATPPHPPPPPPPKKKGSKTSTQNATKMFGYTAIADPTGMVNGYS